MILVHEHDVFPHPPHIEIAGSFAATGFSRPAPSHLPYGTGRLTHGREVI